MIEYEDAADPGDAAEATAFEYLDQLNEGQDRLAQSQDRLTESQDLLRQDFERLAVAVTPLLTRQYRDTEARMRALETRLRNRQERPLIVRMASLLTDVRRIDSAADVKAHVEEALVQALTGVGYQEMGSAGDQFDPQWHEPMSGSVGRTGVVARVHRRGLACYGDVIIKAQVDVEPDTGAQNEEGEL